MNGIDKIKKKIIEEAQIKASENESVGISEAHQIMDSVRKDIDEKLNIIKQKAKNDSQNRHSRILAAHELSGRKLLLSKKQALVSDVFRMAVDKIKLKPLQEYSDLLLKMIIASQDNDFAEVIFSHEDKLRIDKKFENQVNEALSNAGKALIKLSSEARNISGGFILKKGDIEINNSFEAIINMKKDELSDGIVKILF